MGAIDTTYTFTATDVITSTKMNNILDQSTITATAIIGTTLAVTAGKLSVAAGGIRANELAANAVTTTAILDANVTPAKLSNSDFGAFTVASGVATLDADVVTTAKILDANVTTAKILDANITAPKLDGAQTGTAPIYGIRAWAKLNPYNASSVRTTAYKSGNYSAAVGTLVTVTITSHGLRVNDRIRLVFTRTAGTGTVPSSATFFTVTGVTDANIFTVAFTSAAVSSGTVTAQFAAIQASGNISTASYYDSDDDRFVLNFQNEMPNANYSTICTGANYPSSHTNVGAEDTLGTTQLNTVYQAHIYSSVNTWFLNVLIVG